jgi:hypothetical protein
MGADREPREHGTVDDQVPPPDGDAGCDGQPFVGDVERYGLDGCADDRDPRLAAPDARAQSRRRNDAGPLLYVAGGSVRTTTSALRARRVSTWAGRAARDRPRSRFQVAILIDPQRR